MPRPDWIFADFNGLLEPDLLCISHGDSVLNHAGVVVALSRGMELTAYDDDLDDQNRPDAIFATGFVEPSPEYVRCRGSKWSLRLNSDGIRRESDLRGDALHE